MHGRDAWEACSWEAYMRMMLSRIWEAMQTACVANSSHLERECADHSSTLGRGGPRGTGYVKERACA